MRTSKDFDFLSDCISQKQHEYISPTTLKRLWGYISENVLPRRSTLDILSQFLGHAEWDAFCLHIEKATESNDDSPSMPHPTHSPLCGKRVG